jgi:hypothetical protein
LCDNICHNKILRHRPYNRRSVPEFSEALYQFKPTEDREHSTLTGMHASAWVTLPADHLDFGKGVPLYESHTWFTAFAAAAARTSETEVERVIGRRRKKL